MKSDETLLSILKKSQRYLEKKGVDRARKISEELIANILNLNRIDLYSNFDRVLTLEEKNNIKESLINYNTNKEVKIIKDSVKDYLEKTINFLQKKNFEEASIISSIIFSKILNIDMNMLFTKYNQSITEEQKNSIREVLKKIVEKKIPIQYIFNEQIFYGHSFYVDKNVLIPRFDTEVVVEKALSLILNLKKPLVLDIGTGSGVIGITIALENPNSKVLATDISQNAINVAKRNADNLEVKNIKFLQSDLFENIDFNLFDMIISNPPYISIEEVEYMSEDTLLHEPENALFAKDNGLYFYHEITKKSSDFLKEKGILIFEIGFKQALFVKEIMGKYGFEDIKYGKDLNGNDRWIYGIKKGNK